MKIIILIPFFFISFNSFSQLDSAFLARIKALDTANILRADTAATPDDALTQKIKLLRNERTGLTLDAILKFKIAEEQKKDTTHSKQYYNKILEELTTGHTGKLLENCMINIYRRSFTEKEIDDLIVFYKSSAGKKMDKEYLLLLVESVKDLEQLLKIVAKNIK